VGVRDAGALAAVISAVSVPALTLPDCWELLPSPVLCGAVWCGAMRRLVLGCYERESSILLFEFANEVRQFGYS
jgi:hypothetical protein